MVDSHIAVHGDAAQAHRAPLHCFILPDIEFFGFDAADGVATGGVILDGDVPTADHSIVQVAVYNGNVPVFGQITIVHIQRAGQNRAVFDGHIGRAGNFADGAAFNRILVGSVCLQLRDVGIHQRLDGGCLISTF